MLRKAAVAAATLAALASVLTGCSNVTYTGDVTVISHNQQTKRCIVTVDVPGHGPFDVYAGRRGACRDITDGATVKLENGYYKK